MWDPMTARVSCRHRSPLPRRTERSMAQLELLDPVAPDQAEPRSPTAERLDRLDEMLSRYLGPTVIRAMADDDVTEVYVNPQAGAVSLHHRSTVQLAIPATTAPHPPPLFP